MEFPWSEAHPNWLSAAIPKSGHARLAQLLFPKDFGPLDFELPPKEGISRSSLLAGMTLRDLLPVDTTPGLRPRERASWSLSHLRSAQRRYGVSGRDQ